VTESVFSKKLFKLCQEGTIPSKYCHILEGFYLDYKEATTSRVDEKTIDQFFITLLSLVEKQIHSPFHFKNFHKKITSPFDYYQFGIDFLTPLIDKEHSKFRNASMFKKIEKQLQQKENVILFSNHQTESDPQAISIMLQPFAPDIASEIIYVAGQRVTQDPFAIPFSLGCNLLSIYSKRYIDNPPSEKREKQLHNQKTMQEMLSLLQKGGQIIYVAPSGGRDRPNENKEIVVADFDPQSIEMFLLMGKKSKKPTHFYPLSLYTYPLLPPPDKVNEEMGEIRKTHFCSIQMAIDNELDFNSLNSISDKKELRVERAKYIQNIVTQNYNKIIQ